MENIVQIAQLQTQSRQLNSVSHLQTRNEQQGISLFAGEQPASNEYLQQWAASLAAAFPNCKPEFWAMVVRVVRKDGLGVGRLNYIFETLCRGWKYPTLQIADVLDIDRQVKIYSYNEFVREFRTDYVAGFSILEEPGRDGRIQFARTADAKQAGLKIKREML